MSIFGWIMIGALTGWLADRLTGMDGGRGLVLSIVVGIVAAVVGGLIYSGLSGGWAIGPVRSSIGGLLASFLTTSGLLIIARLARITG